MKKRYIRLITNKLNCFSYFEIFLIGFFLLFCNNTFCQKDSLLQEIENIGYLETELISKSRTLLIHSLKEWDIPKMKEIVSFMDSEFSNNEYFTFLNHNEKILISYWTEDYPAGIKEILTPQYRSCLYTPSLNKDRLLQTLIKQSTEYYIYILSKVENADISQEEKDFLLLNLQDMLQIDRYGDFLTDDAIRKEATIFVEKYPQSKYQSFINSTMRREYVPSNWGGGLGFFAGYNIFSADLADLYTNSFFFGFCANVCFKEFTASLGIQLSGSKTKKDIPFDGGIVKKGEELTMSVPEFLLGYNILDNKTLRVAPFGGIGGLFISKSQKKADPTDYKNFNLSAINYLIGFNVDYKIDWDLLIGIRLKYTFNMPQFKDKYNIAGCMHSLSLGFNFEYREYKLKY